MWASPWPSWGLGLCCSPPGPGVSWTGQGWGVECHAAGQARPSSRCWCLSLSWLHSCHLQDVLAGAWPVARGSRSSVCSVSSVFTLPDMGPVPWEGWSGHPRPTAWWLSCGQVPGVVISWASGPFPGAVVLRGRTAGQLSVLWAGDFISALWHWLRDRARGLPSQANPMCLDQAEARSLQLGVSYRVQGQAPEHREGMEPLGLESMLATQESVRWLRQRPRVVLATLPGCLPWPGV